MGIWHISPPAYGKVHYFEANRCFNTEQRKIFNQHRISADEIVSYDCCLFEMREIESPDHPLSPEAEQIIAMIMRPGKEPDWHLQHNTDFAFCGYDLVEEFSAISAITDCGASFECIDYSNLNEYGLIRTYKEAVLTQLALDEEAPNDHHANCEIIELWRKLVHNTVQTI